MVCSVAESLAVLLFTAAVALALRGTGDGGDGGGEHRWGGDDESTEGR